MILSTPDSGVEIKNEEVDPLEAPDFLRVTAAGMTEQEHRGRGTPKREAKKTLLKLLSLMSFVMESSERKR